ncbi:hypothetical protein CKO15_07635 [Halorhodospira abdelmalekii]|uniref:WD40 repeat domain-containing protein n=1 Tax=Halorhodospira abdelmalekii TaxID=421629 RepID=UPI00190737A6|nr:PEGA domain-containing protein [Halorhodospira abdelmalekii]MBK1735156.1 hypothetical protein [Halorhodospira abdelmalekii]
MNLRNPPSACRRPGCTEALILGAPFAPGAPDEWGALGAGRVRRPGLLRAAIAAFALYLSTLLFAAASLADERASLRITTQPGEAQIYIDGREYGRSPRWPRDELTVRLPPGTYRVEARITAQESERGEALRAEREVRLRAASEQTLHLELTSATSALASYRGHRAAITVLAVLPDARALTAAQDRRILLWDLEEGGVLRTFSGHAQPITALVASRDGRHFVTGDAGGHLMFWRSDREQPERRWEQQESPIAALALSPDGRRLLAVTQSGDLQLWDLRAGRLLRTLREGGGDQPLLHAVAYAPDGRRAVTGGAGESPLQLWDTQYGRAISAPATGAFGEVRSVAFDPRGRSIVVGSDDGALTLWDVRRGETVRHFDGHEDTVLAIAVSRDGRYALSGARDGTVKLWALDDSDPKRTFAGHAGPVRAVAFDDERGVGLSVGEDQRLTLWPLGWEGR